MVRTFIVTALLTLASLQGAGQLREIPQEVKDAFANQYPGAGEVRYDDRLIQVQVHFTQGSDRLTAFYSNKGEWKETMKEWSFDRLSAPVKDGFAKSKYADWTVTETKAVLRAGQPEQYRLKVERNELQKKYLLFNAGGRLLEDQITL